MKLATAILLIVIMAASTVLAEKAPDVKDYSIANPSRLVITGTLEAGDGIYTRVFGDTSGGDSETCDMPGTLSGAGADVLFDSFCISGADSEPIEIEVISAAWGDSHISIYCDDWDPAFGDEQLVFFDDDDGVLFLSAITLSDDVRLNPAWNYVLVITSFGGGSGDYEIVTSDNVLDCPVPTSEGTWGTLKSLYR